MNSNIWFISDTHFFHHRIIQYENRPIDCDEIMISNLEELVGPEDTLIHVGDVAFKTKGRSRRDINNFAATLPGKKILIEGNHDKSGRIRNAECWESVTRYRDVLEVNIDGLNVAISHRPLDVNEIKAQIKIYGHVHSSADKLRFVDGVLWVNACVEVWNYSPFHWDVIKKEWDKCNECK